MRLETIARKLAPVCVCVTLSLLALLVGPSFPPFPAADIQNSVPQEMHAIRPSDTFTWTIEVVDADGDAGYYASLALDSADRPHIAHCKWFPDSDRKAVVHTHYDGSDWVTEIVDSDKDLLCAEPSLALDSTDLPHIGYLRYRPGTNDGALIYAHFSGGTWLTETIEASLGMDLAPSSGPSLALDSHDCPHISYHALTHLPWVGGDVRYAWHDGDLWHIETVQQVGERLGWFGDLSLALDSNDHPHISYGSSTPDFRGLMYAHYDGSAWITETVDSIYAPQYSSLSLDSGNRPHIGYVDYPSRLKYAYYVGGVWQIEIVESQSEPDERFAYSALALDLMDQPHLSYEHAYRLEYAWHNGIEWQVETVEGVGNYRHTSIAVDQASRPHIGYLGPGENLKYASKTAVREGRTAYLPMVVH